MLEYATDLFEAATIERLARHFSQVVEQVVRNPEQRVRKLDLLSESERRQVLVEWNDTKREYADQKCVHELFEEQAERTPDRVAVVYEDQQVSYGELNRRANGLAWRLQELGVGPEVRVGLCVERSPEMVVGLLGILKAGGAYVPLDPAYPVERLGWMLEDMQASVLVSQRSLGSKLPAHNAVEVWMDEQIRKEEHKPVARTVAENVAYVMYTSGSTGRPKGVAVTHRGVCNLAGEQQEAFHLVSESVILQFASLSFDASISEWSTALLLGAKLIVANRETLLTEVGLGQAFQDQRVTAVTMPPTVLMAMGEQDFPALKTVVVAGEACPAELQSYGYGSDGW